MGSSQSQNASDLNVSDSKLLERSIIDSLEIYDSCLICEKKIPSSNKASLPCHKFCKTCIKTYLETKINDHDIIDIHCPGSECLFIFNGENIEKYISPVAMKKYNKLLQDYELSKILILGDVLNQSVMDMI